MYYDVLQPFTNLSLTGMNKDRIRNVIIRLKEKLYDVTRYASLFILKTKSPIEQRGFFL